MMAVLLTGCGVESEGEPLTAAPFCVEGAATFCGQVFACFSGEGLTEAGYTIEAECIAEHELKCGDTTRPPCDFDPEVGRRCLDQTARVSCEGLRAGEEATRIELPSCDRVCR